MSTFRASVAAGESGPVIVLTGEVDITNAAELSELVTGQLASQTRHLTIDVDRLDFTDMAAIRVFRSAARTLRQRGAELVLLHPQRALVRGAGIPRRGRGDRDPGEEPRRRPSPSRDRARIRPGEDTGNMTYGVSGAVSPASAEHVSSIALHVPRCVAELSRIDQGGACGAAGPASAPGSALGGPPGARRAHPAGSQIKVARGHAARWAHSRRLATVVQLATAGQ